MKEFPPEKIRNIVLVGHATSGKTTLADAILYDMKAIPRMGKVDAGSTTLDFTTAEHNRKISLQMGVGHGEWRETKINLLDTPGYADLAGDVAAAMRVADCALLVINAVAGVESGTEIAFDQARTHDLPTLICVNLMDKENADYQRTISQAQERLSPKIVPLQLPIGQGPEFKGLIDLFRMKAYLYEGGEHAEEGDIPAEYQAEAEAARENLIEAVAEFDDQVIEKYLEGEALSREEILSALRKGISKGGAYPAMVASGEKNLGVRRMLDTFEVCFPSPADLPPARALLDEKEAELPCDPSGPPVAIVYKTMIEPHLGELSLFRVYSGTLQSGTEAYNSSRSAAEKLGQLYYLMGHERTEVAGVQAGDFGAAVKLKDTHTGDTLATKAKPYVLPPVDFPVPVSTEAISPRKKGEEDKLGIAMHKIMEEDPTVRLEVDVEAHQHLLHAMGELHMEIVLEKLREKHLEVDMKKPRVHFRETITRPAQGQGRYKKQTGGRGQFGDVWVKLEPSTRGEGFEFIDKIVGGVVPNKFIPAVEKGIQEARQKGVVAGYPVVDFKATLYDGSHHAVDSSEMAFKVAGSMAFKKVMEEAGAILLEPILEVKVLVPEDHTGDVMGDLSSRRGKILGMSPTGRMQEVRALVPETEMYHYGAQLRSLSQGRARFQASFHTYEEIPRDSAERIIAAARAALEESQEG